MASTCDCQRVAVSWFSLHIWSMVLSELFWSSLRRRPAFWSCLKGSHNGYDKDSFSAQSDPETSQYHKRLRCEKHMSPIQNSSSEVLITVTQVLHFRLCIWLIEVPQTKRFYSPRLIALSCQTSEDPFFRNTRIDRCNRDRPQNFSICITKMSCHSSNSSS